MAKLTLQEQMLKAGSWPVKKWQKSKERQKKNHVFRREKQEAVEENKKAQLERDKLLSEQQNKQRYLKSIKRKLTTYWDE